MIPPQFDYVRPADLEGVLAILKDRPGEAKLLAGGFSLLPLLKLRLASPEILVDLRDVQGLDGIRENADGLHIGGRATHRQILEWALDNGRYPMLAETAAGIGDPQIRNWGTIAGSVAHADPSADWPAVLIALGATLVLRSADGERTVPARDFFLDSFETAIEPTEILTEVRLQRPSHGSGGAYQKLERRAGDFSTVGVAAAVQLAGDGTISKSGVAATAVAPSPFAATHAERVLDGQQPSEELYRRAGEGAAAQSDPATDAHGPAEYKRAMVVEMTIRALRSAVERAQQS